MKHQEICRGRPSKNFMRSWDFSGKVRVDEICDDGRSAMNHRRAENSTPAVQQGWNFTKLLFVFSPIYLTGSISFKILYVFFGRWNRAVGSSRPVSSFANFSAAPNSFADPQGPNRVSQDRNSGFDNLPHTRPSIPLLQTEPLAIAFECFPAISFPRFFMLSVLLVGRRTTSKNKVSASPVREALFHNSQARKRDSAQQRLKFRTNSRMYRMLWKDQCCTFSQ